MKTICKTKIIINGGEYTAVKWGDKIAWRHNGVIFTDYYVRGLIGLISPGERKLEQWLHLLQQTDVCFGGKRGRWYIADAKDSTNWLSVKISRKTGKAFFTVGHDGNHCNEHRCVDVSKALAIADYATIVAVIKTAILEKSKGGEKK